MMTSAGPVPRGPLLAPPERCRRMHRRAGGTRRWSWLTAAVSAGAHSCGSAPVSHRLPPPGARDRSGSRAGPTGSCARRARRGWARPRSSGHPRGMHRRAATPRPWHSLAWLGWAIAAAACVQLAPSPVYVALDRRHLLGGRRGPRTRRAVPARLPRARSRSVSRSVCSASRSPRSPRTTASTCGGRCRTSRCPTSSAASPSGGTVESSVVLQALASSFTVVGMMAVFGAANALWSHYELVQSTPRAFHELGVVVTVALAFVPATIESVRAVRDADLARTGGHPVRRGRLLRSVVPVLERGLERAVALSESMDARGLRHPRPGTRRGRGRVVRARRAAGVGRCVPRRRSAAPPPPPPSPWSIGIVALGLGVWRRLARHDAAPLPPAPDDRGATGR